LQGLHKANGTLFLVWTPIKVFTLYTAA